MKPGDTFNPHGMFVGSFIPNCMMKHPDLSPTAKLCWARLQQFGGEDGNCYPALDIIAEELGISTRQAQRAVQELVDKRFLKRTTPALVERRSKKLTCRYEFLWHACFQGAKKRKADSDQSPDISVQCNEESYDINVQCTPDISVHQSPDISDANHRTYMSTKDNHLKQKRKDTTTTTSLPGHPHPVNSSSGGCGGVSFSAKEKNQELDPEILRYIDMKVEHQEEHGGFTKGKAAYRRALMTFAKNGELDMSDFDDLKPAMKTDYDWGENYVTTKSGDILPKERVKEMEEREARKAEFDKHKQFVGCYATEHWAGQLEEQINLYILAERDMNDEINHHTGCMILKELYPSEYEKADRLAVKEIMRKARAKNPALFGVGSTNEILRK